MIFPFGRRRAADRRMLIERLHEDIVAAARQPGFYRDCGVPDTFQGRFEMLALHGGMVVHHLNAAGPPGPEVAQDLVDMLFRGLDADLRELGVGDMTVPKRMKRLAEAFLGRAAAYDAALVGSAGAGCPARPEANEALAATIARNIYDGATPRDRMVRYARAVYDGLAASSLDACLAAPLRFPDFDSASR